VGVDLCTGPGFVPRLLLAALDSPARVLCVDLSPAVLEQARLTLGPLAQRATFHAGDAASIPLESGAADWVSLNAGLHHIPEPRRVLGEIDRVLAPGGRFCLGHEPNEAFFASRGLAGLERAIWHAFWYLSPVRNLRRLRRRLGRRAAEDPDRLDEVNRALLLEGAIAAPLTVEDLRRLVDVHTHDDEEHEHTRGFRAHDLRRENFPDYQVESLIYTDYGGDMLRNHPWARGAFDAVFRRLCPGKGRLFSWVLRKPPSPARTRGDR
jgi:SAM-dependent methyltransferase